MEARMQNPIVAIPGAMDVVQQLGGLLHRLDADVSIDLEWISLRASQINGCAVCLDMHSSALTKAGVPVEKLHALPAWRESTWFDEKERAALALTESGTRLADKGEAVSDEAWEEAADLFSEQELAAIVLWISAINFFNRINAITKQVPGR